MITLLRVDSRLVHGQVAVSWTNYVGADCILVSGDDFDSLSVTTMRMGKPSGVKLVIKDIKESIRSINSGATDKYKLLIVVGTICDAYQLIKGCKDIKKLNLGRTKGGEEKNQLQRRYTLIVMIRNCWKNY